ncbi:MAG: carboxypeptidase-like regulatory domain-containing protein [Cyclobacteriaceae bacterium]
MIKYLPAILLIIASLEGFSQRTITGRILDNESLKPVSEATVFVLGTTNETKTNVLGYFQLNIENKDTHLVVSGPEYGIQTSPIPSKNSFTILIAKDLFASEIETADLIVLGDSTYIHFDQIQKGEELTLDKLDISRDFCELKVHYFRIIEIQINTNSPIENYSYSIPYNPKEDKISNLEASIEVHTNSDSHIKNISPKSFITHKESKLSAVKNIPFPPLETGSRIKIRYEIEGDINNIRSVHINDSIPKISTYFSIRIPDYIKVSSNYDSIAPTYNITYPTVTLKEYNLNLYSRGNNYRTYSVPFSSKKLVWSYENLPSTNSVKSLELKFIVTAINLNANNKFGLQPKLLLRSKEIIDE